MSRSRGKRYDEERKLNMKKVIATILVIIVIVLFIISIKNLLGQNKKTLTSEETFYFSAYTNGKWGVINNKGEVVIEPQYEEMVVIPDSSKDIFLCTYDAISETNYKTKVLNKDNKEILTQYNHVQAIDNFLGSKIWYESNIFKYEENGKYGVIKQTGEKVLDAEYDDIYALTGVEKSIVIEKDGKLGLLNNVTLEVVIEPKYEEIEAMESNGNLLFIVKDENNKYGLIGADKKVILPNTYDKIEKVCGNNMYVVTENGTTKVVNNVGEVVLQEGFDSIEDINGERIVAKIGNTYTIINTKGTKAINSEYEELKHLVSDFYVAKEEGKYGIIDVKGVICVDFKYKSISYRQEGDFIEAENDDYTSDIYDRSLNLKTTGIVSEVNTDLGFIKVRENNDYKYYNFRFEEKDNTEVLVNNKLFLDKQNNKYGYKNQNGELVVDYIYDDATEQNKFGFSAVKQNGLWGVLKADGTVLLKPSINLADSQYIDFIGEWHLYKEMNLNVYTK